MSLHDPRLHRNVIVSRNMLREALNGMRHHQNVAATEIARWNVETNGPKAGALADVIVAQTQAEMRKPPRATGFEASLLDASDYPGGETIRSGSLVVPLILGAALLALLALGAWWAGTTTAEAAIRQAPQAEWR